MLIEANFFHHSRAQGPNFTSVRNSTIFVVHNLIVVQANNRQAIGFTDSSTGNQFKNNVIVALSISGTTVSANANGQLLATDTSTAQANTFEHNAWLSGSFGSDDSAPAYTPNSTELRLTNFDVSWFAAFPTTVGHDSVVFAPTATAPWLSQGNLLPEVPADRAGKVRRAPVTLGPYELP